MEDSVEVPQKLKTELPHDPAVPLLGIYLEKTMIQKLMCTPVFTAALLTVSKTWKQLKYPSTDEKIKKMYVYMLSHKKQSETMPFAATWMNLEIIILSEVSQKEKDKHHMVPLMCGT